MQASITYRPWCFFGISLLVPWMLWFLAAYISHLADAENYIWVQTALSLAGLFAPALLAALMLRHHPALWADARQRLCCLDNFPRRYLFFALFLPVATLLAAQCLSICFGHDWSQFHISGHPSFTSALLSPWLMLILAPIVEELAWHSYGTDALTARMSLFTASLLFTVYWVLWHLPLAFIKGYYHSELVHQGSLYAVNFVVSMVAFVILMNWVYVKSRRSIAVTVFFHLGANLGNEVFATHPDSKVIQTVLLLLLSIWIVYRDKALFFTKVK